MATTLDHIPPPNYELLMPSEPSSPKSTRSSSSSALQGSRSSSSSTFNGSIDSEDLFKFDELEESLPSYTPALTKKGLLQMKPELSSPYCRAAHRNWRTTIMELNNTQIQITQSDVCGIDIFRRTSTYSLQFAEIGLASDYTKRPHCFRLRIEGKQAVFDCKNRQEMLSWMVGLQMAISLALPLELRQMPEDVRRRRHRRHGRERRAAHGLHESRRDERALNSSPNSPSRNSHEILTPPTYRETSSSESPAVPNRTNSRSARSLPESGVEARESHLLDIDSDLEESCTKWHPRRRVSRFSEKDFPHLFIDTSWEGKSILYRGRWAKVLNKQIILQLAGSSTSSYLIFQE